MTTEITWTKEELREWDKLTMMLCSRHQMTRLLARLDLVPKFIEQHGQAKCDAMFAELKRRDAIRKGREI